MRRILLTLSALFVLFAVFSPAAGASDAPAPGDSAAAVDQSQGKWYLRNDDGSATSFYFGDPGDYPLFGDWNGNSEDTPGVYRQSDGRVYLRNTNTQGIADHFFYFGNPGDVPLSGDFDGDGMDSISVFRPDTNQFFIINALGDNGGGLGAAEFDFAFGAPGDWALSGDWDGDGVDGVGVYRPSTGEFFLRNDLSAGAPDETVIFGNPGDVPVVGDWDGDGSDEVGVKRGDVWFFQGAGSAVFGEAAWAPVAGFFMSKIGTGRLDIVETAKAAGQFNTLVAALGATGLDDALKGPGPFTVFAPTDDAFAELEAANPGITEALLADPDALTRILLYHVAAGKVPAADVVTLDGSYATTLGDELVWIDVDGETVLLNGSTEVIATDIHASNGIIHVIDSVLVPMDIVETATAAGFDTLVTAVGLAGLDGALSAPNGPYTVFAPTDAAFGDVDPDLLEAVLDDPSGLLTTVLTYHVLSGVYLSGDVAGWVGGNTPATLQGATIAVGDGFVLNPGENMLGINNAEIQLDGGIDIKTSNGVIHIIDAVLVPPS